MLWQPALPEQYIELTEKQIADAISTRRNQLTGKIVILGHHYQQDEVIAHADLTGDSFKLSQLAAEQVEKNGAQYVIFCGVHFMAESADILTPENVKVILPDLSAGCSMADMADYEQTCQAWQEINEVINSNYSSSSTSNQNHIKYRVIPITYMNSSAAIKAFVGQHGGAVCTSSNAPRVFEWALAGGDKPLLPDEKVKILFLPDQHLGRNTAHDFGYVTEIDAQNTGKTAQTAVWDPHEQNGGLEAKQILDSDILLWKGHCSVHMLFRPEHVVTARQKYPGVNIIVHPECTQEVVDLADYTGSTEYILNTVSKAETGSKWMIGTEVHLVNRIAQNMQDKNVHVETLSGCQCLCTTMYRISPERLLWILDSIAEGNPQNIISVNQDARKWAMVALNRMLQLTGSGGRGSSVKSTPVQAL